MTKKIFSLLFLLMLVITLSGCGWNQNGKVTITFHGIENLTTEYEQGSSLPDLSTIITATSDTTEEVSLSFDIGKVNMDVVGNYEITLTASCSGQAEKKTIRIDVVEPSHAVILGTHDFVITEGDLLPDVLEGVTAHDSVEGDITGRIEVLGLSGVDCTKTGNYPIAYSVRGYHGEYVTKTVTVYVKNYVPTGGVIKTGKVLKIDTAESRMLVEGLGYLNYGSNVKVYQVIDETVSQKLFQDVYIGLDNAYFFMSPNNRNLIDAVVIDGSTSYESIRVRVNRSTTITGENDQYHSYITFSSPSAITISDVTKAKTYTAGGYTDISVSLNTSTKVMNITVGNTSVMTSSDLLTFTPVNETAEISVKSISRSRGVPAYPGRMEVSVIGNLLLLVNDVKIEDYLKYVVPSEMPTSFGLTALKAQAVAARTFALNDLKATKYIADGYHVDDSVSTQVYNNANAAVLSNQAIAETKGIVAMYQGNLISANFCSTSGGATSNSKEVWFEGTNAVENTDYLQSKIYAKDAFGQDIIFDTQSESSMLSFFKLIRFDSYDGDSPYHRWKVTLTLSDLKNRLQTTLRDRYKAIPSQILTLVNGDYVSQAIPSDIGTIVDIRAKKRSESGLIIALEIVTSANTFNVYGEYNIRTLFKSLTVNLSTADGTTSSRTNFGFMPSAYFATEKTGSSIVFYGGGYGHGAGMSQYGAKGMADRGYSYEEILKYYYTGINLVDINTLGTDTPVDNPELLMQMIEAFENSH
jgi:SpoIID/LytB domain protein